MLSDQLEHFVPDIKRRDIANSSISFLLWNLPLIYYHYQLERVGRYLREDARNACPLLIC